MATKLATPRHTTPMQTLSGLFRTPSHRNKRARSRTSSLPSPTPSTPSTPSLPAVVLQTYSVSTDSIVLTALPSVPFCCHEDLLTMSRAQLEVVVHALNATLPRRMRIGPEDDFWLKDTEEDDGLSRMSETEMRRRIEELVGIRPVVGKNRVSRRGLGLGSHTGVPPAPKAVRTRDAAWRPYEKTPWEMDVDAAEDQSDDSGITIEDVHIGSSPLASRTASGLHLRGMLPRLSILQEENEGGESREDDLEDNEARPFKRQRRFSSESVIRDPNGERPGGQEARGSRLVEHMDLSGSPLLARDDNTFNVDLDGTVAATTMNPECLAKAPEEQMQAPLQRRRSARIKEIALKRASSLHMSKTATTDAAHSKSNILRSKMFSARRRSTSTSTSLYRTDVGKDSDTPRELTIRLPFTSTPPGQKPDLLSWSAPRILRSHSRRLLNSTKTGYLLGRSKSERYPRASDLGFVTINRPNYRFSQRKSKGNKGDRAYVPSMTASTEHDVQIDIAHSSEKCESEHENDEFEVAVKSSGTDSLHALSSALGGFLVPRPRAPSTSTDTSTGGECSDSPAQGLVKVDITPTVIVDALVSDGAAKGVWEALGRMAVDSV